MICFVARSSLLEEVEITEETKESFSQEDSLLRICRGFFFPGPEHQWRDPHFMSSEVTLTGQSQRQDALGCWTPRP